MPQKIVFFLRGAIGFPVSVVFHSVVSFSTAPFATKKNRFFLLVFAKKSYEL